MRITIANVLKCCIAQRLVPRSDGPGRVPVLDILVNTGQFSYTTDQRQLIAFCQESVERLIRLVKDILDVSKIEAGVLRVQFMPTSLNELV